MLGVSYISYRKFEHSYITVGISLRRKHQYYFFKVTILMWLIVLLSMPVFLYDFDELKDRMGLVSTMFLATAATLYVVGSDLPKTENMNTMDELLLGTLAIIFAAGAESIAVSVLHERRRSRRSRGARGRHRDGAAGAVRHSECRAVRCAHAEGVLPRHELLRPCPPQHAQRAQVHPVEAGTKERSVGGGFKRRARRRSRRRERGGTGEHGHCEFGQRIGFVCGSAATTQLGCTAVYEAADLSSNESSNCI